MTNRRLLIGGGVFTLMLLLLVGSCSVISTPSGGSPGPTAQCHSAVFSPESAPPGSHFFGDGSSFLTLDARSMSAQFAASAACDPFQISVREMIWGLENLPNEAARFARQQQLASDMNLLTAATKRVNRVIKESTFGVDTNWSGPYETLAAAHTDGWHAFKLTKSMAGEVILVQKTKGGRVFLWKVKCLWQPVARVLRGFPVGPPTRQTPPPPTGHHNPPPHNPPPHNPPPPPTTWKCQNRPAICGTPNSGPEQQTAHPNGGTPGYVPGNAETVTGQQSDPAGATNPSPSGYDCGSASCAPGTGTQNPSGPGVGDIGSGGGEPPPDR